MCMNKLSVGLYDRYPCLLGHFKKIIVHGVTRRKTKTRENSFFFVTFVDDLILYSALEHRQGCLGKLHSELF